jgi:hypothetical protein
LIGNIQENKNNKDVKKLVHIINLLRKILNLNIKKSKEIEDYFQKIIYRSIIWKIKWMKI